MNGELPKDINDKIRLNNFLQLPQNQFLSHKSSEPHSTRTSMMNRRFSHIEKKYILHYNDTLCGRKIIRVLNFNSPRTKEAAARIGLTFEDCVVKYSEL